jgi:hypothetical protein
MDWKRWATTTHGPSELIAASFAFWWGLWIWSPGWVVFGTSRTYRVMEMVAPDIVWGGVLMLAAVLLGWASLREISAVKLPVLLFLMAYFMFVTVIFSMANIGSTAPTTYFHVAITFAWLWFTERRRFNGWQ